MAQEGSGEFVAANCVPMLLGHLQDNWDKSDAEFTFKALASACKSSGLAADLCGKDGVKLSLRAIRKKVRNMQ